MSKPKRSQLNHWLLCAIESLYQVRKDCPNTEASKIAGQGICLIGISRPELTRLVMEDSEERLSKARPRTKGDAIKLLADNDWTLAEIEAALAPTISEETERAKDIIRRAAAILEKNEPR
jgi:hypothetical protein